MMKRSATAYGGLVAGLALFLAGVPSMAVQAQEVSFEQDVLPIFELRCVECHQPGGIGYEATGLDLTTYENIMKGTERGPVVIPREPVASTLDAVIGGRVDPEIRMPYHRRQLSKCETLLIRYWIQQGAKNN